MSLRARATTAALLAGGALVLTGCGSTNVAARFDGHLVTEQDVRRAVEDVNKAYKPQQPYTAQQALSALIRAPYLIDYASEHGLPQTESMARADIPLNDPAPSTVRILQSTAAIEHLTEQDKIALSKTFQGLKVTVNPKYGAYDADQALVATATPDWLKFAAERD